MAMALFQGKFGDLSETSDGRRRWHPHQNFFFFFLATGEAARRWEQHMDKAPHRIASHLGAIMYVIIEDTQKDRQGVRERETEEIDLVEEVARV